jgi:hypothetical protein
MAVTPTYGPLPTPKYDGENICKTDFVSPDPVNHPPHYNTSKIEVIDALEAWGLHEHGHLMNVVKYIARAGKKSKDTFLQDLKKAKWYLDRYIDYLEKK